MIISHKCHFIIGMISGTDSAIEFLVNHILSITMFFNEPFGNFLIFGVTSHMMSHRQIRKHTQRIKAPFHKPVFIMVQFIRIVSCPAGGFAVMIKQLEIVINQMICQFFYVFSNACFLFFCVCY